MKVLLDESLPSQLKLAFGEEFEVRTVRDMGWLGTLNGALLQLIEKEGFKFFVTVDKSLRYQQNLERFNVVVFLIRAINTREDTLQTHIHTIAKKIRNNDYNRFNEIR